MKSCCFIDFSIPLLLYFDCLLYRIEPCMKGIIGHYCRPSYSITKESTRTFGIGKNTSATSKYSDMI